MGMDLQAAIRAASGPATVFVNVVITMHDDDGLVLFGRSAPTFRGASAGFFKLVVSEGFSTLGNPMPGPNLQMDQFLASNKSVPTAPVLTQPFDVHQPIPLEFTVTRQTFRLWRFGLSSSIVLNIATLG